MTTLAIPPAPRDDAPPAVPDGRAVASFTFRRARYEPESGEADPPPLPPLPPAPPVPEDVDPAAVAAAHRRLVPMLRMALEVLDGRRSPDHLEACATPSVRRYWRIAAGRRRVRSPARLRRVRVCLPADGVAEVAAVCQIDGRVVALAARFEHRADAPLRWSWTAARLG
jgi:hypothetical protein